MFNLYFLLRVFIEIKYQKSLAFIKSIFQKPFLQNIFQGFDVPDISDSNRSRTDTVNSGIFEPAEVLEIPESSTTKNITPNPEINIDSVTPTPKENTVDLSKDHIDKVLSRSESNQSSSSSSSDIVDPDGHARSIHLQELYNAGDSDSNSNSNFSFPIILKRTLSYESPDHGSILSGSSIMDVNRHSDSSYDLPVFYDHV
jgi:hypothetical protein